MILATGLGTINVANLAEAWSGVGLTATTTAITARQAALSHTVRNASFTVKVTCHRHAHRTGFLDCHSHGCRGNGHRSIQLGFRHRHDFHQYVAGWHGVQRGRAL